MTFDTNYINKNQYCMSNLHFSPLVSAGGKDQQVVCIINARGLSEG